MTSGSPSLDGILGGGYREGRVVEFHGSSGSGKTQLAMQSVLCAARSGAKALFVDTEGTFRPERIEKMSAARGWETESLLTRIEYVRSDSYSEQAELIRRMGKRDATASCRLVAIDTLTRNFSLEIPGRSNAATRQGALNLHLSEMARDAFLNSRAYVLTDRVTFGPKGDTMIGGRTVSQLVHSTVLLQKSGKSVVASAEPSGQSARLQLDERGIS